MSWARKRKRAFPLATIRQQRCCRCGGKATQQWHVCADGSLRLLCDACDKALNLAILKWMRHPKSRILGRKYRP